MTQSDVDRPDGARISWQSDGPEDAPAVLLIMGLAWPAASWYRQVPALAERYRVIRIDNRGAGRTGDVPGGPYTVEMMTADCVAVLDEAGVSAAHVIGISMGGLMAQELALTSPERVLSLCLVATHPGIAHAVVNPDAMEMLMKRATMSPVDAAEASIPYNYAPATARERIEEDWAVRVPLAATNDGYLAQATGTAQWSGFDRIPAIDRPTMVLHGELDRLVPLANGQILAERIPGAELVTVPGGNHVLLTDETDQVNKVLLDWLDRNG
jgi:3-oxoadipate enol-lactonase